MSKTRKSWWRKLWPFGRKTPRVSVVRLNGVIGQGGLGGGPGLTLSGVADVLERAFSTGAPKAVAIAINSPGGSPVQSALIHDRIRALAAEHQVKVFAFAEDVAASGGYMLLLAGDEMFAHEFSVVGSIGVVSGSFGFDRLIERIGVDRRVYTAGASKTMLDPFKPEKPEDVAKLKAILASVHEGFIARVKARRGAALAGGEEALFEGAVWTGPKARELGLVDGVGDLKAELRRRFGADTEFRLFAPQSAFGLFGRGKPGVAQSPDAWLQALENRALWAQYGL
jgi:signal peptide peptidase SppA